MYGSKSPIDQYSQNWDTSRKEFTVAARFPRLQGGFRRLWTGARKGAGQFLPRVNKVSQRGKVSIGRIPRQMKNDRSDVLLRRSPQDGPAGRVRVVTLAGVPGILKSRGPGGGRRRGVFRKNHLNLLAGGFRLARLRSCSGARRKTAPTL